MGLLTLFLIGLLILALQKLVRKLKNRKERKGDDFSSPLYLVGHNFFLAYLNEYFSMTYH